MHVHEFVDEGLGHSSYLIERGARTEFDQIRRVSQSLVDELVDVHPGPLADALNGAIRSTACQAIPCGLSTPSEALTGSSVSRSLPFVEANEDRDGWAAV